MSFKCSIFGHKYGASEVERSREEDGNEVVITVREIETCSRCGETRVVSENKEVRTLETAADIVADDLTDEPGGEGPPATAGTDTPAQQEQAGGQPSAPAGGPSGTGGVPTAGGESIPDAESGTHSGGDGDPPEDDAVILDDDEETDEPEREPGEWPDEADSEASQADEMPPSRQQPAGDREPGEWPDKEDDETEETWEHPSEIEPHPETESEEPTVEPTGNAITVPEGEFYCPNCEFSTPVDSSSLREGDFCPECHKATLKHHDG